MAKKRKRSTIVKELDRVFSQYIRRREANPDGFASCFTCGRVDHWRKLQCGHFMSRSRYSTRWDEVCCQNQCPTCNVFRHGEQYIFGVNLDKKYGNGTSDSIHAKSLKMAKFSDWELEEMIEHYKEKLKGLI